jgi:fibronectin type 3 domain-containing protein
MTRPILTRMHLLAALALAWPAALLALGAGTSASDFDNIAVGARPAGMGNAFSAAADDSNAPFWNPAGLALVSKGEANFMHMLDIADINYDTFSVVLPSSRLDGWGLSGAYLWQPPFDSTQNSFGITPASTAAGTGSDLALAASYARNFGNFRTSDFKISNISAGVTLRYISRQLQGYNSSTFNLDFGGIMEVIDGLRVALVVQNVGSTVTFIDSADPSVPTAKLGAAWKIKINDANSLMADFDLSHPVDLSNADYSAWYDNLGLEYWLLDSLALRGGYQFGYSVQGLTAGAGFKWHEIGLDYAFVPYAALGNTHRISLTYAFGSAMSRPDVAAPNAPQSLKGVAFDQLVSLAWDASPERDVIGYNVYYSKTSGKGYVRTTEKPEPKQNKLSVRLKNDENYYFVITAVNAAGKESEFSDEILMRPHAPDKPKSPLGLKADVSGRTVTLTWSASADKRVIGYNVYYTKSSGKSYRKLTTAAPLTEAECRLRGLTPDSAYYFVVTSVTKDGLESDIGTEVMAKPRQDTVNEAAPEASPSKLPSKKRSNSSEDAF